MVKQGVYILRSQKNDRFYVGSSIDVDRRFIEHNDGKITATKNIRPLELVFLQEYGDIVEARKIEYKIKKAKSRVIIQKIIADGHINMGL